MIEDGDSKFDDYSHWGYELTEKDFFYWLEKLIYKNLFLTLCNIKSYYWFNRKEILQKRDILKKMLLSIIYKTKKW